MPDPTPTTIALATAEQTSANTAKTNATTHANNWLLEKNSMIDWLKTNVAGDGTNQGTFQSALSNLGTIIGNDSFAFNVAKTYLVDAKAHLNKLAHDGGVTATTHNPAAAYISSAGSESDYTNVSLPTILGWSYTPPSNNSGNSSGS